MNILYITISGNTRSFVTRMQAFAAEKHTENPKFPIIQLKEIHDNSLNEVETEPFFVVVPTYLEGGNGVDNGDQEILTEALREYIAFSDNASYCLGIIGSGNKNFGHQYCLTAKQYAEQFQVPFLADFELRGNQGEIQSIYENLVQRWEQHTNK
ncbi:class Ib ribonucleoside-diphosphate reductase assembly flavoprotein NrdI [Candidatus Enterococcus willemsii]|uniref:Ribonucleotide reductase assembly protein NrdI n=1 Tax=Candidatus Enterococcus willemsii TaxID=1857215 RepID=A0ABQ6YX72_9ENTE|nr:class Ib ribonucleoside-diphosphate reductase assembly flavoprotein NrdI [Enterococcus sp. CU12B]KAF1302406.1 ribonucleotide reductase assembly protein NrdI [Enterococcus sp. CU12B]